MNIHNSERLKDETVKKRIASFKDGIVSLVGVNKIVVTCPKEGHVNDFIKNVDSDNWDIVYFDGEIAGKLTNEDMIEFFNLYDEPCFRF